MFTKTDRHGDKELNLATLIPAVIGLVLILSAILGGFYTVQPWQVSFEKTFGKVDATLNGEGLYFKLPFVTDAVKMNTRNVVVTAVAWAASKDVQVVTTEVSLNYSLQASSAVELYTTVWSEDAIREKIVWRALKDSIKASTAKFNATEAITKRDEVAKMIQEGLAAKLDPRGITINQIDILDINFSDSFNKAIEAKVTAEQNALKAKEDVEKVKYEAESKIAKAEGEAKAVEIAAIAEAQAIKIKANAIQAQGGADYIELKRIEKWKGDVPTTVLSDGTSTFLNLK